MAHFYGSIQGARGEATRLGSKGSGLRSIAASWQGAVSVDLYEKNGVDMVTVSLRQWHGKGSSRTLYDGPVGGTSKTMIAMVGGKRKTEIRNATPIEFRDLLLSIARSAIRV